MNARPFFDLVCQMRECQKRYFNPKTRTQQALEESRRLELAVDQEIYKIRQHFAEVPKAPKEPTLFEQYETNT